MTRDDVIVAKGKGAAVRMPDSADYTARLDGERYRLQRARQVRNVSLD